jgi:hypothetical protein
MPTRAIAAPSGAMPGPVPWATVARGSIGKPSAIAPAPARKSRRFMPLADVETDVFLMPVIVILPDYG